MTFWLSLIEYLEYKNFVNSERSLFDCIMSEIHSKVVFVVTLGFTFHNLSTFRVITNWRRCRGTKVQIFLGYKRHTFRFDCWWWRTVRYQQGCASFTWRLHLRRIQFSKFLWRLHCQKIVKFEELIQYIHLSRWVLCRQGMLLWIMLTFLVFQIEYLKWIGKQVFQSLKIKRMMMLVTT